MIDFIFILNYNDVMCENLWSFNGMGMLIGWIMNKSLQIGILENYRREGVCVPQEKPWKRKKEMRSPNTQGKENLIGEKEKEFPRQ